MGRIEGVKKFSPEFPDFLPLDLLFYYGDCLVLGRVSCLPYMPYMGGKMMSSSLAVYLRSANKGWSALFAYGVTDESFAVNLTRFRDNNWDWRRALVVNQTANVAWIASS